MTWPSNEVGCAILFLGIPIAFLVITFGGKLVSVLLASESAADRSRREAAEEAANLRWVIARDAALVATREAQQQAARIATKQQLLVALERELALERAAFDPPPPPIPPTIVYNNGSLTGAASMPYVPRRTTRPVIDLSEHDL